VEPSHCVYMQFIHSEEPYNHPAPFLVHSVCMKPNFQGLPWFEFDGLDEGE
jgi:hypothetical protein